MKDTLDFLIEAWMFARWLGGAVLAFSLYALWGLAFMLTGWFPIIAAEQAAKWDERLNKVEERLYQIHEGR